MRIIAISTLLWGAMTTLSGFARSFGLLFLARVGVGVGEAGCSPAAYSILSGYFPPEKRSGAMAIYGAGLPTGGALGLGLGGLLAQTVGWRGTMWIFGLPSIVAAGIVSIGVKDPPRGPMSSDPRPTLKAVLGALWIRRSFRHATAATALLAFAGFGGGAWVPSFLVRSHNMPIASVGLALAATSLLVSLPATLFAGRMADMSLAGDPRVQMRLPAVAILCAVPLSLVGLALPQGELTAFGHQIPNYVFVVALLAGQGAASSLYVGPVLAAVQEMVPEGMRATTIAVFFFVTNLVGMGLGPVVVGLISDAVNGAFGHASLRFALVFLTVVNAWAAMHYWMASKHVIEDIGRAKGPGF